MDGTVIVPEYANKIMKEMLGFDHPSFKVEDCYDLALEQIAKYKKFAAPYLFCNETNSSLYVMCNSWINSSYVSNLSEYATNIFKNKFYGLQKSV